MAVGPGDDDDDDDDYDDHYQELQALSSPAPFFPLLQFLDHDITLVPSNHDDPTATVVVNIPTGDPVFDPMGLGNATISFTRSLHDSSTGNNATNPREQMNTITHWIDASMVG